MRVTVIGTGYVGLVAGAGFADFGNEVTCVDSDAAKIAKLTKGEIPIYEPGLDTLVAKNERDGRLRFTTDLPGAVAGAEVVIIAVGTPEGPTGAPDLSAVHAVARAIGPALTGPAVIVTKSTVPVGTADAIHAILAPLTKHEIAVASNPEFLKEGDAVNDFMKPDRVVIGIRGGGEARRASPGEGPQAPSSAERVRTAMRRLYAPFVRTNDRLVFMDARSAELTKYAANALLATRISFMNELSGLAEKLGADIELVRKGLGSDPRIGNKFLFPGAGFGGSCFPKDVAGLLHTAKDAGVPLALVEATRVANERQKLVLPTKVRAHFGGSAKGKKVAVWGLAFKPQTDDIREAPALVLIDKLLEDGATVVAHDPAAMPNVAARYGAKITLVPQMYDALAGADALVLVTEWHEFRRADFARIKAQLAKPVIFDGRNIWDPEELAQLGFTYHGIGRGLTART